MTAEPFADPTAGLPFTLVGVLVGLALTGSRAVTLPLVVPFAAGGFVAAGVGLAATTGAFVAVVPTAGLTAGGLAVSTLAAGGVVVGGLVVAGLVAVTGVVAVGGTTFLGSGFSTTFLG